MYASIVTQLVTHTYPYYCKGAKVRFLGERQHRRRSAFRSQYLRPAADDAFEEPASEWAGRLKEGEPSANESSRTP
ncbi:hypothetical protein ACIBI7_38340 [Nonomuraea fuscirosea]|uniref:hypothetical protein n=1 Tax=Nonomuraea fuscirosea TaxID=1291556 RepID=UPI00378A3FD4